MHQQRLDYKTRGLRSLQPDRVRNVNVGASNRRLLLGRESKLCLNLGNLVKKEKKRNHEEYAIGKGQISAQLDTIRGLESRFGDVGEIQELLSKT